MHFTQSLRRLLLWVLATGIGVTLAEATSYAALALVSPRLDEPIRRTADVFQEQSERIESLLNGDPHRREILDSRLGWRYRPGHESATDHLNRQGLRAMRQYALRSPGGTLRVAAFGDSFVYGNEVADRSAWTAQLEAAFPHIEVLNYGVGGYGTDQAYLRFLAEGMALSPDVVLIGFVPVSIGRAVNVYRRFLSTREWPLAKPRFHVVGDSALELLPNPLPTEAAYRFLVRHPRDVIRLGEHDYWYESLVYENALYDWSATVRLGASLWIRARRRLLAGHRILGAGGVYDTTSVAFLLQERLLATFARRVEAAGAAPVIVLFPDRESVARASRGEPPAYAPLRRRLDARGLRYIDLLAAFAVAEAGDEERWFMPGGHYSAAGNDIVARRVGEELSRPK